MEERMLDEDENRTIRVKRTQEGAIADVEDMLAAETAQEEEQEFVIDIPEPESDEYDDDLVGLTPQQLKEEMERREKAEREAREACEALLAEGDEKLTTGDFEGAEPLFAQALVYDSENEQAAQGLWRARTKEFTDHTVFFEEQTATEASQVNEKTRQYLMENIGEKLTAVRSELNEEATPLRDRVEAGQAKRREAFVANRNYYLVRFGIFLGLTLLALIGVAISASFLTKVQGTSPVIALGCCAGVAVIFLVVALVYTSGLITAARLCHTNEKLSSTDDGAHLEEIDRKIELLDLVLESATESEPQESEESSAKSE